MRLVLAGIAVSALFSSGVGVLKYLFDPLTQPRNHVLAVGRFVGVTWRDVGYTLRSFCPASSLSF
jgi:iron complex transport system permease protein